jgi:hypothetical protein
MEESVARHTSELRSSQQDAERGWFEVLHISDEFDHDLDERCQEIIGELAND